MNRSLIQGAITILLMVAPGLASQRALLIGNDSYPGQELINARNDATAFAEALNGLHWQTTLLLDARDQTFHNTVASFIEQLSPGDTALVYYSGHGMQVDGVNYLLPVDFQLTDKSSFRGTAVSLNGLLAEVLGRNVKVAVFILDACRNNPFQKEAIRTIHQVGWASVSGLTGTFLAFGTAPGSTASDNPAGNHGLFTQAILDNLQKNSSLDLDSFFRLVRQEVLTSSSALQVPWTASSLTGTVSFSDPHGSFVREQRAFPFVPDADLRTRARSFERASMQDNAPERPEFGDDVFVRAMVLRGLELLKVNRVDEAVKSISSVLATHPHAAMVLRILSLIFQLVGRNVDSVREADLAIVAAPGDSRGYAYRGFAEAQTDPTGAVRDEHAALGISPATEGAYETLAQALLSLGNTEAALTSAQKGTEISPSSPIAYSILGKIYQKEGDYAEASRAFRIAASKAGGGTIKSRQ